MVLVWRYGPLLLNACFVEMCTCCSVWHRVVACCSVLQMSIYATYRLHTYTHFHKKGLHLHKRGLYLCPKKGPISLSLSKRHISLPHGPHHMREEEGERGRDRVCWAGTAWVGVRGAADSTPP